MRYYCIRCGMSFPNARDLLANNCPKGPLLSHHVLYEGAEKSAYTCRYCGRVYGDFRNLVTNVCPQHPERGACHVPAL